MVSRLTLRHIRPEITRVLPKFPRRACVFTKVTLSSELTLFTITGLCSSVCSWGIFLGNQPHMLTFISGVLYFYDSGSRFPVSFLFLSQREKSQTRWASFLPLSLNLNHRKKSSHVFPGGFVSQYGEEGMMNASGLHRNPS